jgi:hypothetical protein
MKRLVFAVLLSLVIVGVLPALAAQTPLTYDVRILRCSGGTLDHVHYIDTAALEGRIRAGEVEVLDRMRLTGCTGMDLSSLAGDKYPMFYNDPRTGGAQVQYVDFGFRCVARATPLGTDRAKVDLSIGRWAPVAPQVPEGKPVQYGMIVRTIALVRYGQTAIVCGTRGRLTGEVLAPDYPGVKLDGNDRIFVAVSLNRP